MLHKNYPHLISDSQADRDQVKMIKEKVCKVAQDFDADLKSATENAQMERRYTLPGDKPLFLKEERIKCPELLFQPGIHNRAELEGIHKYTFDSIMKCDQDIKKDLFKNIVMAGGCTMFQGMQGRMKKEI